MSSIVFMVLIHLNLLSQASVNHADVSLLSFEDYLDLAQVFSHCIICFAFSLTILASLAWLISMYDVIETSNELLKITILLCSYLMHNKIFFFNH